MKALHLDQQYQAELDALHDAVVAMGHHALAMVRDAARAVLDGDQELARSVIARDDALDRMEVDTDARSVALLARRAPVGEDLRLVTCALKVVTDLERIGDLAVSLAERTEDLSRVDALPVPPQVRELVEHAVGELAQAVAILRDRDATRARQLKADDRLVDAANRRAFDHLIQLAKDDPLHFEHALTMTNVCRHLERIGDHAVNIGEMVVYLADGAVVKHIDAP